jgi:hypothetical protein
VGQFLPILTARLHSGIRKTLLTRTDLRDFALGASDVDALCTLAHQGTKVLSLAGLHAKVYIVDDKQALVTSANATDSGMGRNWECGISTHDRRQVQGLSRLLLGGFGAAAPPEAWGADELELLRDPVRTLRDHLPPLRHLRELDARQLPAIRLTRRGRSALLSGFSGWLRLTLEGVVSQPKEVFALDSFYETCEPLAATQYPRNRHIRPKLRQQLQRLRDLGLVDFLGRGKYRRTVEP